mmetsp:Transcript_15280/g.23249  ORF Transcript_15280/g.23249 Transcript_15280/m.23249 type:complete len:98 (+) Transcript_15280:121-414(+)
MNMSKLEKGVMLSKIFDFVGKFVKLDKENGQWYEASMGVSREKIGQQFYDLMDAMNIHAERKISLQFHHRNQDTRISSFNKACSIEVVCVCRWDQAS